ncbi:MAG: hypothetical protein R2717_05770 [Schumannella sp.]
MAKGVDLAVLARKTPGFTGADLANVLNEAALLTARSNAQLIDNRALDEAVDWRHGRAAWHPDHERQGEADHGLPRGRPRPRCGGVDALHRPGHQGHDPPRG